MFSENRKEKKNKKKRFSRDNLQHRCGTSRLTALCRSDVAWHEIVCKRARVDRPTDDATPSIILCVQLPREYFSTSYSDESNIIITVVVRVRLLRSSTPGKRTAGETPSSPGTCRDDDAAPVRVVGLASRSIRPYRFDVATTARDNWTPDGARRRETCSHRAAAHSRP